MTRSSLGVAATSYLTVWETMDTLEFLERCSAFGAAGIQAVLRGDPLRIRTRAEELGMYVEAMVPLPVGNDTAEFERSLQDAKAAGALALRAACLPARRYEVFADSVAWETHVRACYRSLTAARPLLDKYKIPLGLENHKDWTLDEFVHLMKHLSSEYFGVCLDFGNNISLLDPPMETIEKLAPYTVSTHVKDMSAQLYEEGILLSEVVLGHGYLDMPRAIQLIRQARPKTRMTLEMITRDPLKIPVLADKYWGTMAEKKGLDLARTLRFVQQQGSRGPLPRVSHLPAEEISRTEDKNVMDCLAAWPGVSGDQPRT